MVIYGKNGFFGRESSNLKCVKRTVAAGRGSAVRTNTSHSPLALSLPSTFAGGTGGAAARGVVRGVGSS